MRFTGQSDKSPKRCDEVVRGECLHIFISKSDSNAVLGVWGHVISPFTTGHKAEMIGRKEKTSILVKEISKIR